MPVDRPDALQQYGEFDLTYIKYTFRCAVHGQANKTIYAADKYTLHKSEKDSKNQVKPNQTPPPQIGENVGVFE